MGNGRNLRAGLDEIRVPVVVIISPQWQTTNLEAAGRRGIEVSVLPGVGHFLMLGDRQAVNLFIDGAVERILHPSS